MDIDRIRAETPGLAHGVHLLACGAALMPLAVQQAVVRHTELEGQIGGYEAHAAMTEELNGTYDSIARLVGASRDEIALLENATVAWCHAFYALPLKKGDRILTCEAEYAANYVAFLHRAKRDGIEIDVIPSTPNGELDLIALENLITDRTALIAITWVPTNGGLVNPAAEVGKIAKRHNIPYLLDACQALGQMEVNVNELGCDFLSATGRKFLRGPRGTGFLYIRKDWLSRLEPAMIDHFAAPWISRDRYELRPDARRFETWENAYALRLGLKVASDYAQGIGLAAIRQQAWCLADYLRGQLGDLKGAKVRDIGKEQCAIVSFTVEGLAPRATVAELRKQGIYIGASDPESTRLDSERRALPAMLRAAPHYYNNRGDCDRLIKALQGLV